MEISLCMIVKNEEDVLARCLNSVKDLVDEIIIVDTGSDDATKKIASLFTDFVYDFAWCDDFSAARNFAFSKGTKEYLMWLDADDVIDDDQKPSFLHLKQTLDASIDLVALPYQVAFDEQGHPTMSYERERIFKREKHYTWVDPIHEVIAMSGKVFHGDAAISHRKLKTNDPDRNLHIFEKMIHEGKKLNARQQFYYARELYYHAQYEKALRITHNFLMCDDAWIENQIDACRLLSQCHQMLNHEEESLTSLILSFQYDTPRAEILCDIGSYFFQHKRYAQAIYWYQLAADTKLNLNDGGFHLQDCYGFIPYIQLCVCYDHLGNHKLAYEYNEKAGKIKPDDPSFLSNRKYFESLDPSFVKNV